LRFVTDLTYFVEGKATEGGTVRKVLLLAALAMVATLVFAPTVLAQADVDCPQLTYAEAQAILAEDPTDPNGLDADNDGEACDANAGDGSTSTPDATPTPEPTTMSPTPEPTTTSPTPNADDAQYKTASPTITALPETGGSVSLAAAMIPLALLVGGGLLAFGIVRRS
jgi:hypothetical protein